MAQKTAPRKRSTRSAVENAAEIEVLASPTRIELVDTVEALGSASVAELAEQLGRPADGLYYHLRQLAAAGLLVEEATAEGKRYSAHIPHGEGLRLRYRSGCDGESAKAVGNVASSVLRIARPRFQARARRSGSVPSKVRSASSGPRAARAGSATASSPRSTACCCA